MVQNLHQLWHQYTEAKATQEEALKVRTPGPLLFVEKAPDLMSPRVSEYPQLQPLQETNTLRDPRDPSLSQKTGLGIKSVPQKSIMEKLLVEEGQDRENTRSPWDQERLPLPKWNLCLEDFRQVLL